MMEKVPDCLDLRGTDPPKNWLHTARNCSVLSPFLISFTENPHKAWRGANRFEDEGRILVETEIASGDGDEHL